MVDPCSNSGLGFVLQRIIYAEHITSLHVKNGAFKLCKNEPEKLIPIHEEVLQSFLKQGSIQMKEAIS